MKKDVIRVGDTVRVLRPRWVKRVGYPLVWTDLAEEVRQDPRTRQALELLGIYQPQPGVWRVEEKLPHEFVRAVAMLLVEQRGFGGSERAVHYYPLGNEGEDPLDILVAGGVPHHGHVGRVFEVTGKRRVKTGTRFPAHSWRSGPDYEYDYSPGGLENCKTHVLLTTWAGEIEVCDVEKVKANTT